MNMNGGKCLVLDTNILIRAVLGKKVRSLIEQYAGRVNFYTPDVCYEDARKYLPLLMEKSVTKAVSITDWTGIISFMSFGL